MTKYVISFAGVPGSSKTPISYHLSWNLGLPIFNNDALRTEVKEDHHASNQKKYEQLRNSRLNEIFKNNTSFIYDASSDRHWDLALEWIEEQGYVPYIISMDLSRPFVEKLYVAKGYDDFFKHIDMWIEDHEGFQKKYPDTPNLRITDETFPDRLALSLKHVSEWITQLPKE